MKRSLRGAQRIMALFQERESRDELGLGGIRRRRRQPSETDVEGFEDLHGGHWHPGLPPRRPILLLRSVVFVREIGGADGADRQLH